MEITITADHELISAEELKTYIEDQLAINKEYFSLQVKPPKFRGVDPIVLVAIIGATSTVLSTLITALLALAKQSQSRKIVVQTENGQRIEIPEDMPLERLDQIILKLKEIEIKKIQVDLLK